MVTKTDSTYPSVVPGTEVAIWSLKLILHTHLLFQGQRLLYVH
jgi:hypothetical protein